MKKTEEAGHERGLAGAIKPDEADDFAWREIEVEAAENGARVVALAQIADSNAGRM